jgi:hypothetical protein
MEHVIAVLYIAVALPAAAGERIGNRWQLQRRHSSMELFWLFHPVTRLEKVEGKLDLG